MIPMNEAQTHECLADAGCDQRMIAQFDDLCRQDQLRRLADYRRLLLDHIHAGQKKLDRLDYLIWTIQSAADVKEGKR